MLLIKASSSVFKLKNFRRLFIGLFFPYLLFSVFSPNIGFAQITLSGQIKDASTKEPIPFATAVIVNQNTGDLSDTNGFFQIRTSVQSGEIKFSATGYVSKILKYSGSSKFSVSLSQDKSVLNDITIKAKKVRYRNKNNPAVSLIRQVIDHKSENQLTGYDHVQYQDYEKYVLSYKNPGKLITHNFITKKYAFLFKNIDTTTIVGERLLPAYIDESIYDEYLQKSPQKKQSVLIASKRVNLNKKYVNNESLGKILKYIYTEIDLYDDNIFILSNNFLSPISTLGPQFYKYFIVDTVTNKFGQKTVELSFVPRNTRDMLFSGTMYIALNGHYSLTKAIVFLPKLANVNWVDNFHSIIEYAPDSSGKYYLKENKTGIEFGFGTGLSKGVQGIYAERTQIISHFDTRTPIPDSVFDVKTISSNSDSIVSRSDSFWKANRPVALSKTQMKVYKNVDSLNHMRSFNRLVSWVSFASSGFKNVGPIEIGPYDKFLSFNSVEGFIFRLGGRTTNEFSRRFYISGNEAYGFGDQRWKYEISGAYSFNKQNVFYGYPQHYFQATLSSDTWLPGVGINFGARSNVLASITRGTNNRYLYSHIFRLDYVNELIPNLRFDFDYEHWHMEPAGDLFFVSKEVTGEADTINEITTSGFGLDVRWAPHEKFVSGRENGRMPIKSKYPIIEAQIKSGIKGLNDGQYNYTQLTLNIQKRFYLSWLGYADVILQSGYLFGKVPYPLLFIPAANQSYIYMIPSYNLMNYLEFVNDHFASIDIDYHMKGLILNNIPGIKWLRLREVAGFKLLYGGLRAENSGEALALPINDDGQQITYALGWQPYMEFNVGIENILHVIRIDYVQRLSYLHNQGISTHGIRISAFWSF